MSVLFALVVQILATLPIVAAFLVVRSANASKTLRARHFSLPFAALAYAVVACVVLYRFNRWLDGILVAVFTHLPLLAHWYEAAWLYTLENTLVVLVFAALKFALRPVLARWVKGAAFKGSLLVAEVYEFDAEQQLWFVKRRLGDLRLLLRGVYWASLVLAVVLIALAHAFPAWSGFQAVSYPAIPVLVLGECFFAVDGLTKPEFEQQIVGEADDARRVTRYSGLRRVLADVFGDRLLAVRLNAASTDAGKTHDRLDELLHSPDDVDRVAGVYFQRIKQAGEQLDTNLIDTAVALLHSTSAVINNPFYPDLTRYLVFPAYYHLLQYRKVLIIAGRDAIAHDLVAWMSDGLESISGVPQLWDVRVLGASGHDGLDVGVLRFADLHNLELIRNNDAFFAEVEYVILAEPSQVLATGQLGLGLVLSRCGRDRPAVYAAFDRNHDGLVDALSHLLKTSLTEVAASSLPTGTSVGAVWRAEGPRMSAAILPRVTRYLGMGTEIAAVALKNQVSAVTWVGAERFPVSDMSWIAGQYYQQITSFAELEISQQAVTESIVPWSNPWSLPQDDNRFLVVEDEFANAFEALRLYATRARDQGFVNMISEDYLLRDYMVANADIFAADPKAIPSIAPDFARTERNSVLRLILAMQTFGVTAEEVAKELEIIGVPVPDAGHDDAAESAREPIEISVVAALISKHTGVEPRILRAPSPTDADADHPRTRAYRIAEDADLGGITTALHPAYFFVEDEVEDENYVGALLFCHVFQAALPGQFVTYGGKYYEVQGIGSAAYRNGVVLRRAAEHITDRRTYRQLRRFTLEDLAATDAVSATRHVGEVELIRSFATVSVETDGFVEVQRRSDLAASTLVTVSGIPRRRYVRKEILQLRLPGIPASVRTTLAVLLNELFVTVFPHAHHYVVALTAQPETEATSLLPGLRADGDIAADTIFFVEDSLTDLGLTVAIERNWERLLAILTDYLDWRDHDLAERDGDEPTPEGEIEAIKEAADVSQ